jgi:hypothetical protein
MRSTAESEGVCRPAWAPAEPPALPSPPDRGCPQSGADTPEWSGAALPAPFDSFGATDIHEAEERQGRSTDGRAIFGGGRTLPRRHPRGAERKACTVPGIENNSTILLTQTGIREFLVKLRERGRVFLLRTSLRTTGCLGECLGNAPHTTRSEPGSASGCCLCQGPAMKPAAPLPRRGPLSTDTDAPHRGRHLRRYVHGRWRRPATDGISGTFSLAPAMNVHASGMPTPMDRRGSSR